VHTVLRKRGPEIFDLSFLLRECVESSATCDLRGSREVTIRELAFTSNSLSFQEIFGSYTELTRETQGLILSSAEFASIMQPRFYS